MSAWVVNTEHIDYLVHAARITDTRYRLHDRWLDARVTDDANLIGRLLLQENITSVYVRYEPDGNAGQYFRSQGYEDTLDTYTCPGLPRKRFSAVAALKAVQCYEYQSCEHPEWRDSAPHQFCQTLTDALISHLPGYDDAPWEIDADTIIAA